MEPPRLHLIVGLPGAGKTTLARHALVVPKEELWAPIDRRNADLPPDTFHIARERLEAWWALFEPPDDDELCVRPAPDESE